MEKKDNQMTEEEKKMTEEYEREVEEFEKKDRIVSRDILWITFVMGLFDTTIFLLSSYCHGMHPGNFWLSLIPITLWLCAYVCMKDER